MDNYVYIIITNIFIVHLSARIVQVLAHISTYIYKIKTEDEDAWWYMPKWFHEDNLYRGF